MSIRVDDLELLAAWRNGDAEAGDQLIRKHLRSLSRFFYNKVSLPDGEDLVQATLAKCVAKRDDFRGHSSYRTYLFTVARNTLLDHVRKVSGSATVTLDGISVAESKASPASLMEGEERRQRLLAALRELPLDQQTTLELYYWEGLTSVELAEVLGIADASVRSRIKRARDTLRRHLPDLGDLEMLRPTDVEA